MEDLKEYVEQLDWADEAGRTYAAEDIGYLQVPEGVPPLLQRLNKETSRTVRDAIFQALIRIEADAAIEGAIQLLYSEDPQIRNQAVDVLRRKCPRSIPFLAKVMREANKHLRKLVLDVLSGVAADPNAGAGEIYTTALSDPDPNVVITAVENLGSIRAGEFRVPIEALLQQDAHPMLIAAALEALAGIGNEASLDAIRKRFPVPATLPDFLLEPWLKTIAAMGSDTEFDEVASLLSISRSHLHPAILNALLAIYPRCRGVGPSGASADKLLVDLHSIVSGNSSPLSRYRAVRMMGFWAARHSVAAFLSSCLIDSERMVRLGAIESLRMASQPELSHLLAARSLEETDEELLQALNGCENIHA